jgi:hypothetical protein
LYKDAAGILDIENQRQTGLTMRSFEALATGRFLVTTNQKATELLTSHSHRIIEIDMDDLSLPLDRLRHPPGWNDDLNEFSIENWIKAMIEC